MEETKAQQSRPLHHKVDIPNYLVDPDDWRLLGQLPNSNEVKMSNSDKYSSTRSQLNSLSTGPTVTSTGPCPTLTWTALGEPIPWVKKEEYDKALTRIKELKDNQEFLERANNANWSRYLEANKTIRKLEASKKDLEAKNECLGNYAMGKAVETVNDGLKMYEFEDWQEEYGWTSHIFDPLDNNPLLGCKKWMA